MVGYALDVGVFLCDDLYMSNARGVSTYYRVRAEREGKGDDERNIMSQISLPSYSPL